MELCNGKGEEVLGVCGVGVFVCVGRCDVWCVCDISFCGVCVCA